MSAMTIKSVSPRLHRSLKRRAARNHRSLNSEILLCLEEHLRETEPSNDPKEFLAGVRSFREKTGVFVTDKDLDQAINEGRP